jgi:hypothetical protein
MLPSSLVHRLNNPPPNQPLHLTGAAILVLRDTKVFTGGPGR